MRVGTHVPAYSFGSKEALLRDHEKFFDRASCLTDGARHDLDMFFFVPAVSTSALEAVVFLCLQLDSEHDKTHKKGTALHDGGGDAPGGEGSRENGSAES